MKTPSGLVAVPGYVLLLKGVIYISPVRLERNNLGGGPFIQTSRSLCDDVMNFYQAGMEINFNAVGIPSFGAKVFVSNSAGSCRVLEQRV